MMNFTRFIKDMGDGSVLRSIGIMFFLLLSVMGHAQEVTVTGTVKAGDNGLPLPMANVVVKGGSGVSADIDGNYSIKAKASDVLVFSYLGYVSQEITVGNKTLINVTLSADATTLDDVVVIGYGSVKKSDLTGSVGVVNVDDAKKTVTYDVAKMLQGQAAGVTVQSSGEPGGFVNLKIRGITSFTDNNPLFVIDGILVDSPYDFAPGDIETMQILKDATSTAIYGVRGANGVVIITTKKGKAGKVTVNFKSLYGFQNVAKKIPLTNREQYQRITNTSYINGNRTSATPPTYGLPGNDLNNPANAGGPGSPTYSYIDNVDTNWQNEVFRTGTIQNQSFTVSGGSDKFSMNFNVDNYANSSYMNLPQDYNRLTSTANLSANLGRFKFGSKLAYTHSTKQSFAEYLAGTSAVTSMLGAIPTMPVYDPNRLGGYGGADNASQLAITLNPIGWFNLADGRGRRDRFVGNIWGEVEIVKGLKYTLRASADQLNYQDRLYIPESDLGWYYVTTAEEASLEITDGVVTRTVVDNLLSYSNDFGKHHVDATLGYVQEKNTSNSNYIRRTGFASGAIAMPQYGTQTPTVSEYLGTDTRLSTLGRANYSYDDRYFITGTWRRDKSSLFAEDKNSADFYSVAGSWKFQNDIKLPEWMSAGKLRAGYGKIGNNAVSRYAYSSQVNGFANASFNNNTAPGTTVVTLIDPNIQWEKTTTTNAAIELGFFKNRLEFTAEYYVKQTDDLLASVPLPYSTGSFPASIWTNAASMRNKGWEFTLGYKNYDNAFKWGVNANFSTLKNEVTKIGNDNAPIIAGYAGQFRTEVGRSIGEIYVYEVQGIFQNQAEIDAAPFQPNAQPGSIRFADLNGDGIINDQDRSFKGLAIPTYYYGLNLNASYKNWDMSMFFQGHGGNKIFSETYRGTMIGGLTNHHTDMLNHWTPTNTNTNVPMPDYNDLASNNRPSDRYVQKGDYLRMQNIELGYSLPFKDNKFVERARLYVSGQNVFTLTKYKMYDPDFTYNDGLFSRANEAGGYPNPRTILIGVDITF